MRVDDKGASQKRPCFCINRDIQTQIIRNESFIA